MFFQATGTAVPSIATEMIEQMNASENKEEAERLARKATGIAYVGKVQFLTVLTVLSLSTVVFRRGRYCECSPDTRTNLPNLVLRPYLL